MHCLSKHTIIIIASSMPSVLNFSALLYLYYWMIIKCFTRFGKKVAFCIATKNAVYSRIWGVACKSQNSAEVISVQLSEVTDILERDGAVGPFDARMSHSSCERGELFTSSPLRHSFCNTTAAISTTSLHTTYR